jgi:hypothetical protein
MIYPDPNSTFQIIFFGSNLIKKNYKEELEPCLVFSQTLGDNSQTHVVNVSPQQFLNQNKQLVLENVILEQEKVLMVYNRFRPTWLPRNGLEVRNRILKSPRRTNIFIVSAVWRIRIRDPRS